MQVLIKKQIKQKQNMKTPHIELFKEIDEFCEKLDLDIYQNRELKMKLIKKHPQVKAELDKWKEDGRILPLYQSSPSVSFGYDKEEKIDLSLLVFYVYREFQTHEELITWCKKHLLILPKKSEKCATVVDGKAITTLTYKMEFGDTTFVVSYKREGLPGRKCRIESSIVQNIVCDLK